MPCSSFDARTKSAVPLVHCSIDDALTDRVTCFHNALTKLINVVNPMFVHLLPLHQRPDLVVHRIQVWTVQWPGWRCVDSHKVRWLHFTGEVNKLITIRREIYSGFCEPEITKISSLWLSYLKEIKVLPIFWNTVYNPSCRLSPGGATLCNKFNELNIEQTDVFIMKQRWSVPKTT